MADSTPAGQASSGGGETPASTEAAPPAKAGGLSSFLPLIIAVVVMPIAAYVTITIKSKMSSKAAPVTDAEAAHEEEPAPKAKDSHGGGGGHGGHGAAKEKPSRAANRTRNLKLAVPLTREPIAYVAREDKAGDVDKIVILDTKGETKDIAQSDKIVTNIANTGGSRYILARISLISDHQDFLERLNENRERLIDVALGALGSKTMEDYNRPGFRSLLKPELRDLFNQQLGVTMIQEVIIHDLVIQ